VDDGRPVTRFAPQIPGFLRFPFRFVCFRQRRRFVSPRRCSIPPLFARATLPAMVTVRAPATSANLGSGFDVFGRPSHGRRTSSPSRKAAETTIEVTGVGAQYIPEDPKKNTVGAVVEALDAPARIHIDKGSARRPGSAPRPPVPPAPPSRSTDCTTAGSRARSWSLIAAEGEAVVSGVAHSDNVAPSILGGFTVTTSEGPTPSTPRFPSWSVSPTSPSPLATRAGSSPRPPRWTTSSRRSATPPLSRSGCAARSRPRGRRHERPVVTPERARLITGYDEVRAAAFDAGATGVTVSGAGPAILAVCRDGQRRGSPPRCSTLSPTLASTPAPTRRGSGGVDGA